jgi:hypothetical protein
MKLFGYGLQESYFISRNSRFDEFVKYGKKNSGNRSTSIAAIFL